MSKFIQINKDLGNLLTRECLDTTEVLLNKNIVQNSYTTWIQITGGNTFLNWGLWDKKIYNEFLALHFTFTKIPQNIYQQLLLYSLIRPLINIQFFNKRLLEIGCGNGLGLKASAELLRTDYALGVDLVSPLVKNASYNFYELDKVNYIQSDAEHLPLKNKSFDIVINLESSHLYPRIETFFFEVERVLAPGGYFCYSDFDAPKKAQSEVLEHYISKSNSLKIIQRMNITKLVQASIYKRIITHEDEFYNMAVQLLRQKSEEFYEELLVLAFAMGLSFLPWWNIWLKNPLLRPIAKAARKDTFWKRKHYFYYLIQKIT